MRPLVLITALQGTLAVASAIPTPEIASRELVSREAAHVLRHDVDSLNAVEEREKGDTDVGEGFKKREKGDTDVAEGFKKRETGDTDIAEGF
ncbi:hypothetical protein F5Y10DRAFT_285130 [Nemania abortiva]|nr:hypothetical protein F5Y10DRAFT_285130 [Nemania abortiva]